MTKDGRSYLVPTPASPYELQCVTVYVPKHLWYLGAFWAAYEFFTSWNAWVRDPLHRGKQAAALWRKAYEKSRARYNPNGECEMNVTGIRLDPLNPCNLQVEFDGSNDWQTVADLTKCGGNCGGDAVLRYTDGGVQRYDPCEKTWQPAGPVTPAVGGATPAGLYEPSPDVPCLAATNIARVLTQAATAGVGAYIATGNALQLANAIAAAFALVSPGFQWFEFIAPWIADILLAYGGAWSDVNSLDIEESVAEIIAPFIDEDGSITDANFLAMKTAIIAKEESYGFLTTENVKWGLYDLFMSILGAPGLVKAEAIGGLTVSNCGTPGWVQAFDFTTGKHGWTGTALLGQTMFEYLNGEGWHTAFRTIGGADQQGLNIGISFEYRELTKIKLFFDAELGIENTSTELFLFDNLDFVSPFQTYDDVTTANGQTKTWTGSQGAQALNIGLKVGDQTTGLGDPGGFGLVTRIELSGLGTNPFT